MVNDPSLTVTVVYSPKARQVSEVTLLVPATCTVLKALQLSGLLAQYPEIDSTDTKVGVWGKHANLNKVLRDMDRIEIYRPLRVDPKVARRERFVAQGSRGTGLFVKKRAGAKAGY